MIKGFADKETRQVWELKRSKAVPADLQRRALRKLEQLDVVDEVTELMVPLGNKLEKLKGDREGQYSVRINQQYRACFVFENGDAYDVEIVDYH